MRQSSTAITQDSLSPLDRAIIARLQIDGRVPFSAIAAQLQVAESTVQRRVEQLIDEGYFKIIGVVNLSQSRADKAVLIGIYTDAADSLNITRAVADIPEVRFAALVTGAFDVVCEVVTSVRSRLREIMIQDLPAIRGVRRLNSSWVLATYKTDFVWDDESIQRTGTPAGGPPRIPYTAFNAASTAQIQLDELDEGIVRILGDCGRTSYVDLASQLGTTVSTARRRTLRLLESKYVQVVALGDPHRLGYQDVVLLWIKVDLSHVQPVLGRLVKERSVWYLTRVAGTADIVAGALFSDSAALLAFLDGPMASIDGIREMAVSVELTTYKRAYVHYH